MRASVSVDVIIPFCGSPKAFSELVTRVSRLQLGPDDSLTIVDNTRIGVAKGIQCPSSIKVLGAPGRQSSYYARNRGAASGRGKWLVFLDADLDPVPDLISRYLDVAPASATAVLCGSVRDVNAKKGRRESLASRYARVRRLMDQSHTMQQRRPFAKTANCAVRRVAFEQLGGFIDNIRSGGDADLCFRLQRAGWDIELRSDAVADHFSRRRLIQLIGQQARHGSGCEWLETRYPGFLAPRRATLRLVWSVLGGAAASCALAIRGKGGDEVLVRLLSPVTHAAFELGRRVPNAPWREQLVALLGSSRSDPT